MSESRKDDGEVYGAAIVNFLQCGGIMLKIWGDNMSQLCTMVRIVVNAQQAILVGETSDVFLFWVEREKILS